MDHSHRCKSSEHYSPSSHANSISDAWHTQTQIMLWAITSSGKSTEIRHTYAHKQHEEQHTHSKSINKQQHYIQSLRNDNVKTPIPKVCITNQMNHCSLEWQHIAQRRMVINVGVILADRNQSYRWMKTHNNQECQREINNHYHIIIITNRNTSVCDYDYQRSNYHERRMSQKPQFLAKGITPNPWTPTPKLKQIAPKTWTQTTGLQDGTGETASSPIPQLRPIERHCLKNSTVKQRQQSPNWARLAAKIANPQTYVSDSSIIRNVGRRGSRTMENSFAYPPARIALHSARRFILRTDDAVWRYLYVQ